MVVVHDKVLKRQPMVRDNGAVEWAKTLIMALKGECRVARFFLVHHTKNGG
jgi:hypothetical protein